MGVHTTRSAPPEDERKPPLESAQILVSDEARANPAVQRGSAIGKGIDLARRLGMLPGNICTPDYLADTARDIAKRHGMNVTVLGRAEMEREKMGSFLCVAQGTPQDPKLIALEYTKRHGEDARRSCSSARDSASTPAASPSSPRRAWSG